MRRSLALVVAMAVAVLPGRAGAAERAMADQVRDYFGAAARAHGIDPALFLRSEISLGDEVMTLDAAVQRLFGAVAVDPPSTNVDVMAGDTVHTYANAAAGSALGYTISTSSVVPSTPPVLLPPPATTLFIDYGGPLRNIKGSYALGIHAAGTVIGSSVEVAVPPGQAWVPVVNSDFVSDTAIDFVGHALATQGQACIFGLCLAVGAMLGDGIGFFSGAPAELPVVP